MILHKIESPILQNQILKNFPKIELSYENYIHNKVLTNDDGDIFLAIPKGKKYFLLFLNDYNYLIFLELAHGKNQKNQISNMYYFSNSKTTLVAYNKEPCAIFYGTLIYNHNQNNSHNYFCIEDVYYYNNKSVKHLLFLNKLELMYEFFDNYKNYSQYTQSTQYVKLRLPYISTNIKEVYDFHNIDSYYKVHHIIYYSYKKKYKYLLANANANANSNVLKHKEEPHYSRNSKYISNHRIFKVKPDIQNDIYYLYSYDDKSNREIFYDIACIPSYETSVMMNNIFRKIKENTNLDLLEESDDEEEFENEDPHQFVNLDMSCNMKCVYNNKFKKWVPLCIHNL